MPEVPIPKNPDPMTNLVVKSTGAPAAAPCECRASAGADSGHRAKRRRAPRGGGAARAHRNMATAS